MSDELLYLDKLTCVRPSEVAALTEEPRWFPGADHVTYMTIVHLRGGGCLSVSAPIAEVANTIGWAWRQQ